MSGRLINLKKKLMDKSFSHMGVSEIYTANAYLDRLFTCLKEHSVLCATQEISSTISLLNYEVKSFLDLELFKTNQTSTPIRPCSLKELKKTIKYTTKILESFYTLNLVSDQIGVDRLTKIINIYYKHARIIHLIINQNCKVEIQLPRVVLSQTKLFEEKVPLFSINPRIIEEIIAEKDLNVIKSLKWQREAKYDQLLHLGHKSIALKEYDKALELFQKAHNFIETAEILNLIGWTYSFKEQIELAKAYCLKAIKKDPDYGPPYNDMGSYVLAEGNIQESLKWFDIAKNAKNYQNREYPYINSARAYLSVRENKKALEEFSRALSIAPYHEELHETVIRLKESINKSEFKINSPNNNEEHPPVF